YWTATASHVLLGLLADPFGNRMIAASSPDRAKGGQVNLLVEVADPVQGQENDYEIDGVRVSDFVTPAFFSNGNEKGAQYDIKGHLKEPLKVGRDGFLSWVDDKGEWYQATWFGSGTKQPEIRTLGKLNNAPEQGMSGILAGVFHR